MEETLTNCLLGTREDLTELKRVREYLDSNTESQTRGSCSVSWRTIEAFNSILAACASQDSPDIQALDTLLDSLYYVACNNEEETVWNNFGFELGVICVKVLSTIEQTDMFEVLFCKFLEVINKICQHNSDAWKAVGRQILNVFINKKFGYSYLETVLKIYVAILRNVDSLVLYNFAQQNHQLIKTLSMIIQRVGDFETQTDILEIVFLHVSNDKKLMEGFFMETKDEMRKLFQKLQFIDFEKDSRTYLNALNENLGIERKVYSIRCKRLLLGGIPLEPPVGRETIWMDANNDSERLTIKCSDFSDPNESVGFCVVYIQFPDLVSVKIEQEVISQSRYYQLTFKTKNLKQIYERVKSDDVICCTDFTESVSDFKSFLEKIIKSQGEKETKKRGIKSREKLSQTCDQLFIDRSVLLRNDLAGCESCELQDNSISSSIANKNSGIRRIIPDALSLLDKIENKTTGQKISLNQIHSQEKTSPYFRNDPQIAECQSLNSSQKNSVVLRSQNRNQSPTRDEKSRNIVLESQELTPNSFVESLNKNLGLDSPEVKHSFEDSLETVKFVSENATGSRKSHKLFRSPNKIFNFLDCPDEIKENNFVFKKNLEDKENIDPNGKGNDFKLPVNQVKKKKPKKKAVKEKSSTTTRTLRERTSLEIKLTDSQSEKYFRSINSSNERKKKPSLPKLKRAPKKTPKPNESKNDKKTTTKTKTTNSKLKETRQVKERRQSKATDNPALETVKSSLLDPNGYAFQRWLKPTTSERSNFWLKKLNENPKEKVKSSHVFDYSDESDSEVKKTVRKGRYRKMNSRRVISTTKRKRESRKSDVEKSSRSEPPLKQVKNISKSRSYPKLEGVVKTDQKSTTEKSKDETEKENKKPKDDVQLREKSFHESSFEKRVLRSSLLANSPEVEKKLEETCLKESYNYSERIYDNIITRRSSTDESFYNEEEIQEKEPDFSKPELQKEDKAEEENEGDEDEIFDLSEDDTVNFEEPKTNKRERSDEENSLTRAFIKKKAKTQTKIDLVEFLPSALETKIQEREEKLKQETNEIIETVKKATNQLLSHFQKKQCREFVSYLTSAKEAGSELVESDGSRIQIKRLERIVSYLKTESSVSEMCVTADKQLGRIRKALKDLAKPESDNSKKIEKFNDRLKNLIENEIDRSIKKEYASKRNRLLRCASIFGFKLGG